MPQEIDKVFESLELDESAVEKIKVIFEAAASERSKKLTEEKEAELMEKAEQYGEYVKNEMSEKAEQYGEYLKEAYEDKGRELVEQYQQKVTDMEVQNDVKLTEAVKQWISENKVELVNNIKMRQLEEFVSSMRTVFAESQIDIPESEVSALEEANTEVESLKEMNSMLANKIKTLSEQVNDMHRTSAFDEISEGLSQMQVEKLRGLSEDIQFTDAEQYKSKLVILRDAFLNESVEGKTLNEEVIEGNVMAQDVRKTRNSLEESVLKALRG